ncbi:hypothetical protein EGT74_11920 [Chitinophaga lutea]|uniref:PKD domain-containing protein n=1 Tax=Chitinophaga lutea TaxID=2488634 RepID=A0A3N4Q275_9BACT|nr:gliding motility-associated C-terminal domain-containing protein [Chitinophaga lutea]RPE14176.1 hypothetical protein EGT74_11920 [Chitinophaga lutea]
MKRLLLLFFVVASLSASADHITGGEMYYTYSGIVNGLPTYHVTLKQFRSCFTPNRQFASPTYIGIFNKSNGQRITDLRIPLSREEELSATSTDPCITRAPLICYKVGYWEFDVSLPASPDGYILTSQVTNRVDAINNLEPGYGRIGATYTAEIPGTPLHANSSARFTGSDLVTICADNAFSYSFAAEDGDGDQLRYYFCEAYQTVGYSSGGGGGGGGGGPVGGNNSQPPVAPPYHSVPYGSDFSGGAPLGNRVRINPNTGLITGIAPGTGIYVVTVCVQEIRNGVAIATQRKDLQINITGCTVAAATLQPEYMLCRSSQQLTVANMSNSPLISTYYWEFSNSAGNIVYTSNNPVADHTFSAPGTYTIKLATNRGLQCPDSIEAQAFVYPGFQPAFSNVGACINKPVLFRDETTTRTGTVNFWDWDFGEATLQTDFSDERHPTFTYPGMGTKNVRLIVHNTDGCKDTLTKAVDILDKPPIGLRFRDTLICPPDRLQLQSTGTGVFTWSPAAQITGANTASPFVAPLTDTKYYVDLDQNGCLNRDSVMVRVVDHVSLRLPADTVICQGDPITLRPTTNGLLFTWTPAAALNFPDVQNPVATITQTTTFSVTASISQCRATDNITVTTVPYPRAFAGADTVICFDNMAQLHGLTDGNAFTWQTTDANGVPSGTTDPLVRPAATAAYIFTATDNRGCPKPVKDTVVVRVLPKIHAFAGRDTAIVLGQPLQLNASGGQQYTWSPAQGLSSTTIHNPVALFNSPTRAFRYKVTVQNEAGCADSAFMQVKVYNTLPQVFVPTAFTPNGDGLNDQLRPIAVGIREIEFFMVYNRWGQLVYSGKQSGSGWNGHINGTPQSSGVYVWQVKAKDYLGYDFFMSGTATLLR